MSACIHTYLELMKLAATIKCSLYGIDKSYSIHEHIGT